MRARIVLTLAIGCALASGAWAGDHDKCCGPPCGHCIVPPPPFHPKCTCPCDECRLRLCSAKEAPIWIEQLLTCSNFEGRKKAAAKLGCRWHADFCQTPEVLTALIAALHCDVCWEVRRAAATSLREQNARTPQAILSLYIASKLDPHYLVRERANESLDILLILQRPCYKQLLKDADELIKKLRGKYKPGTHDCQTIYSLCGQVLDGKSGTTGGTAPATSGARGEDDLPGPTNLPSEAEGKEK
ncbi:MAG TPA: HEAT repeat domain-containing protein [Gemmataceae bacterium]|jgi:hypothetical protein